jgi:hypothetical protein
MRLKTSPLVLIGLLVVLLAQPGSASAALVGPPELAEVHGCGASSGATSFTNLRLPEGRVRSPITGTVTKWRVNIEDFANTLGPVRLLVERRTANNAGLDNDKYKVTDRSQAKTTAPGINRFDASLSIRKGDFIGLTVADQTCPAYRNDPLGVNAVFFPALPLNDPTKPTDIRTNEFLLYNATVRD